jgi:SAM-dependent methyltransferase
VSAAGDVPCPLCAGSSAPAFATCDRNRGIGEQRFTYRRCLRCASLFLDNVPADLSSYYPEEYFTLPSIDALRAAARQERYRMGFVARHARSCRLTEIGPGNGIFAIQAVDAGFDTAAIEMDERAAAYLRDTLGIEVVISNAPEQALAHMPPSRAIAAWHVLEHVPRPWAVLDAAAANLEPGGVLVIATPNPRALGLRVLGPRWPHVDAPRHLYLLDHEALIARAAAAGLELTELSDTDAGARHWNAFAWHYALRGRRPSYPRDRAALVAGRAMTAALAPVERRGLRGAAYTVVLTKR